MGNSRFEKERGGKKWFIVVFHVDHYLFFTMIDQINPVYNFYILLHHWPFLFSANIPKAFLIGGAKGRGKKLKAKESDLMNCVKQLFFLPIFFYPSFHQLYHFCYTEDLLKDYAATRLLALHLFNIYTNAYAQISI